MALAHPNLMGFVRGDKAAVPGGRQSTLVIHRQGRIGDTLVALPALRTVAAAFPDWNRVLLTDSGPPLVSMPELLNGTDIVHSCMTYRAGERNPTQLFKLFRQVRSLRAEVVVFLTEWKGTTSAIRDHAFFRLCGIPSVIGSPHEVDHHPQFDEGAGLWEAESNRLARIVSSLGEVKSEDPDSWRLSPSIEDREWANQLLAGWAGRENFLLVTPGVKVLSKDWGLDNWRGLLRSLAIKVPGMGVAVVGAQSDRDRVEALCAEWPGPSLPIWHGSPKKLAVLAEHARMAVCPDGGPMHVIASVGCSVVALFSGFGRRGQWWPYGTGHVILENQTPCSGCEKWICPKAGHPCMQGISVEKVAEACVFVIGRNYLR